MKKIVVLMVVGLLPLVGKSQIWPDPGAQLTCWSLDGKSGFVFLNHGNPRNKADAQIFKTMGEDPPLGGVWLWLQSHESGSLFSRTIYKSWGAQLTLVSQVSTGRGGGCGRGSCGRGDFDLGNPKTELSAQVKTESGQLLFYSCLPN